MGLLGEDHVVGLLSFLGGIGVSDWSLNWGQS